MNARLIIFLLLFSQLTQAGDWVIDLPLNQDGQYITDVTIATDGVRILYFPTSQLINRLSRFLSKDTISWLDSIDTVTPQELTKYGVHLELNPQTLQVDMKIASSARSIQRVGIDSSDHSNEPYSTASRWSWQNSMNISHQQYANAEREDSSLELLGGANIGGADGINATYRIYGNNNDGSNFYRGPTQLFYDHLTSPWRVSLGDVEPITSGHLPGLTLGGITWDRAYQKIQPYRQLRNSGTQSLELEESAEVTIYINDIRVSRIRLAPGRYELDDLPLTNGTNDIRLDIRYTSGRIEEITYSQFYNAQLLKAGLLDFSLSAGVERAQVGQTLEYSDQGILIGFYEYGLSDKWTIGTNALTHQDGYLAGVSIVNGSDIGNISMRTSANYSPLNIDEKFGHAISLDYSQQIFGSSDFGSPNFRISYEWQEQFNSTPWAANNESTYNSFRTDYQWYINESWDASFYASYQDNNDLGKQYDASSKLAWRNSNWRVSLTGEYTRTDNESNEFSGYINMEFFYDILNSQHRLGASYNSKLQETRLEARKYSDNVVGGWGYEVSASNRESDKSYLARTEYNANRWRGQIDVENIQPDYSEGDTKFYGSMTTALTVADNKWGWSRNGVGSNVLVDVHPSLAGSNVQINPNQLNQPEAIATSSIGNVIPLSRNHQLNTLTYSVPDAPIGYSLGSGIERYKPGSLTTHILTIGSDATRTIIATALTNTGEPVALYAGLASNKEGYSMSIFTNSTGRFVIDGISSGTYQIKLGPWLGEIIVSENDPILIYLDDLILQPKEDNDE
ncbi:fimbria/pilus outer membrane usher protein [Vibrio kyushuensis]|uniref:fimbria/pilus outer membrane usher protein n=1 Tax=Vibrio kyushuensis TaxID=2910249 RepID=UPI003D0A5B15